MELKSKTLADGSIARIAEIHFNGAWRFTVTVSQEDEGEWRELFDSVDEAYWAYGLLTEFGPITEKQAREAAEQEEEEEVWSIDLGIGYKDVEAAILERLEEMQEEGELGDFFDTVGALAEFIQDTHANGIKGEFSQDDLDAAIEDASDRFIGEDLEEYVGQYLDEDPSPIVAQYQYAIIDAMIHDMKCGGEIAEYQGVWFRSY